MRALRAAELRASREAWLSVSLTFVVAAFCLCLPALVIVSATDQAYADRLGDPMEAAALPAIAGLNLAACLGTGLAVIGAATFLVVDSCRGAIARLALAGATPGQVIRLLVGQLAVVSVLGSVVGNLAAVLALRPTLVQLAAERALDDPKWAGGYPLPTPRLRSVCSPR